MTIRTFAVMPVTTIDCTLATVRSKYRTAFICAFFVTNGTVTLYTFILYQKAGNVLLTLCSTVLLEKLTVPQLVKKFTAFYEARWLVMHSQQPITRPYPEPDPVHAHPHPIFRNPF